MATRVEIGCGVAALACFAGAVDAWLGTGALDALIGVGLGGASATGTEAAPATGHDTHASLFLAAALALVGLGFTSRDVASLLQREGGGPAHGVDRRRLIAALVFVARCCKGATPADVAEAFQAAMGETLERGEIANATKYLRSERAASIETILSGTRDDETRRRIMAAVSHVWLRHGSDSRRATEAIERVSTALGLQGDDINMALDGSRMLDPAQLLSNVEAFARRTVSRATSSARRISTRIRNNG
jgi:hypothetical protein